MKSSQHTTSPPIEPLLAAIGGWALRLELLHARMAPHFARPQVHQHALLYLQALLSDIPRKNGWQIAEQARQTRPDGMQRLLSQAVWDQEGVRNALRTLVVQSLSSPTTRPPQEPFPVLVLDESGMLKRGHHSAGVALQYCGRTGRVEQCQMGVFLSYVTAHGHALIDRELYLPQEWCADLPRCQAAHVPESVCFQTKPELGMRMIERTLAAGVPVRWVVADTVYGHSPGLRQFLRERDCPYALAVACSEVICVQTPSGLLLADGGRIASQGVRPRQWQRLSMSQGSKGERLFDWACLPIAEAGVVDGRSFLLIRRCLDDPSQLAFYLLWTPPATSLSMMVQVIGARWHVEEDLQMGKGLGLDHYEVRSWVGWYRHVTLVLLACAFLLALILSDPVPQQAHRLPLTRQEAQHLLAHLLFPPPTSAPLILGWSLFRRTHQYWAGYYHRRRRAKAG